MVKRTIGNYLTQTDRDFPVDAELFAAIQDNESMLAIIGNIAGDKAILHGCRPYNNGSNRAPGYVFIRTNDYPEGEILYFEGGATQSGMHIKKEDVSVASQGKAYPNAYVIRSLVYGVGDENYDWADFAELTTIPELLEKIERQNQAIALLQPTPVGTVQMWAGKVDAASLPANYMLCDGTKLSAAEYPALYSAIGTIHNASGTTGGYFNLPDLRGRFIAGYAGSYDTDYYTIGRKGGEKRHTLTVSEMPSHQHYMKDYYYPEAYSTGGISGNEQQSGMIAGSGKSDSDNGYLYYKNHYTESSGGGSAHENRPPYYTLAYIIRVK